MDQPNAVGHHTMVHHMLFGQKEQAHSHLVASCDIHDIHMRIVHIRIAHDVWHEQPHTRIHLRQHTHTDNNGYDDD